MMYRTKIVKIITAIIMFFCGIVVQSQTTEKQIIQVEKMEYASSPNVFGTFISVYNPRVILANDSIVSEKMKQSVLSAISNRWNSTILNPKWSMNSRIFAFNKPPRLKTKLKNGVSGSWHLFFQVIDNGSFPIFFGIKDLQTFALKESLDNEPYHIKINASIIDGSNENVIFSNEMVVEMQRSPVPEGQILLQRVPGLTDSFLQAFNKAVHLFFSETPQKELKLEVTPACLFLDVDKTLPDAQKLNFISKNDSIIELLQLKKQWVIQKIKTEKTKRVSHAGENLVNAVFSVIGAATTQVDEMGYQSTFGFRDLNEMANYYLKIPFTKKETQEDGGLNVSWNSSNGYKAAFSRDLTSSKYSSSTVFDSNHAIYLIREKDTIGSLKITIGSTPKNIHHPSQCWDGKSESTLAPISESLFNINYEQKINARPYILEGEIYKTPFIIEKSNAGNQVNIKVKEQDVVTLKIYNDKPVLGLLYAPPTDEKVFSILMMLSSMPINSIF